MYEGYSNICDLNIIMPALKETRKSLGARRNMCRTDLKTCCLDVYFSRLSANLYKTYLPHAAHNTILTISISLVPSLEIYGVDV